MKESNVIKFLDLYKTQNIEEIRKIVAPSIEVSDPHFPIAKMIGLDEVVKGLEWSFQAIRKTEFDIINIVARESLAFVEIDTVHYLKVGLKYRYFQLLKIEYIGEKISCVTTYVTYPPGGLRGIFRRCVSIIWQAKRRFINVSS